MAFNSQENTNGEHLMLKNLPTDLSGDEIVISGISGIFPKSGNVEEFMNNLYNKVDMVNSSEDTWSFIHPEMPKYCGKVEGFDKFDAQFFRVPYGQGEYLDPVCRKLLENAYGALFDAGVNPVTLAGTKLGVFAGSSYTDTPSINVNNDNELRKYMITGSAKTMQANRISYWIDSKTFSYNVDQGCSSSMAALEQAFWAMKKGQCTSAIVTGSNQFIDPMLTLNLRRAGLLCLDGKTKCFDKNGDGYVRSEAICVLFLQRASEAKRIYAEVVHTKSNYCTRPDANFLPIRNSIDIEDWLLQFYKEVDITPNDIEYIEACANGIAIGDANELEALGKVFADGNSIKVGSVKSNMGHSEGASDLCSITKACLAYHKGELPGNLHYNEGHDIAAIKDGRIQINTENVPFKRGYTAFNSFSYSGMNHHLLMKGHYKKKSLRDYKSSIPRLVLASGRINSSVSKIFDSLKSKPVDAEQIALINDFFASNISGHTSRGYVILDSNENETVCLSESISHYSGVRNPVWFMYSGMGSQWPGMGAELMKIPTFAASINRCHQALINEGLDVIKILTEKDESLFDNILNSFVGIAAMQAGLTDLLKEMGIVPDNIIGHSLGELGCAYADGCLTTEEFVMCATCRGLTSNENEFIDGLMAAVNLGHEEAALICPPEIEVACHNSPEFSTISGPAEIVRKFVKQLINQGIFAKVVNTGNIAFHSKYIADAGPHLLSMMKQVLKSPKLRSKKWICTSEPPEKWHQADIKYASAEYFTNNLLNNVYFEEAAKMIPENAIIIEISPHGLMQPILRKSHDSCTNLTLTKKHNPDSIKFLLEVVGNLYKAGLNPKIDFLYPKVQYPVSTETPLLSPLVGWAHDETWSLATYSNQVEQKTSLRHFAMVLDDDDWEYIKGHVRNGAIIFPEAALLVLVWETLAKQKGLEYSTVPIIFESIRFEKELYIKKDETVRFTISLQSGNKRFEIFQEDVVIVSGLFDLVNNTGLKLLDDENNNVKAETVLTFKEIYTLLGVKGYSYKHDFQSILSCNTKCNNAYVKWNNQWVLFLDSLFQLNVLSRDHEGLSVPKIIRKLTIDPTLHRQMKHVLVNEAIALRAIVDDLSSTTRCGGVQIEGVIFNDKPNISICGRIDPIITGINNEANDVSYAGPSLNDSQNIIRNCNGNYKYGMDFSGHNSRGDKVMGLVPSGALASTVEADPSLLWPVPEHWSMEDAATVPLPYVLAYYCLTMRGRLQRGEKVLVIGGAGALGQAVISICLALNCTVFTTVSNNEKKQFLLKIFPTLPAEHINCTAKDLMSFRPMVVHYTKRSLCNYVISCASGEMREILHQLISDGIVQGIVKPIARVTFSPAEVPRAFRHLVSNRRIGRVLIRIKDAITNQNLKIDSRVTFLERDSYLVVCDETFIGIEIAHWLVKKGARKIILHQKTKSMLSYFYAKREEFVVVINSDDQEYNKSVSKEVENIRKSRSKDNLPALVVNSDVGEITTNGTLSEQLAALLNTIEQSIRFKYNNVIVNSTKKYSKEDFLESVSRIIHNGVLESDDDIKNQTLNSLNIKDVCLDEIRNLINSTFKIDFSKEELQRFTFARLKSMCVECKEKTPAKKGLRVFYDYIERDEIQASEPIVQMRSKIASCTAKVPEELDSKETHLIMIPGFEGHSRIFTSVGERLKVQAVTLQLAPDLEGNSIPEMAESLIKYIKRTFEFKSKFYILGYSFGANVALELAALLEKEGYLGVVYCLDSSPDAVRVHLDTYLGELTDVELQNIIIKDFFQLISGQKSEPLNEELQILESWSEKVQICLKKLKSLVTYSHEYQRAVLEAIYKRITLSRNYEPKFRLKSEVVLMKAIDSSKVDLADDYNLSKYTTQPVRVFDLECDHSSAPYNCRIPNIVNKMLEPELLEKYRQMDLWESYYDQDLTFKRTKQDKC
ncbi:fatty acid synthase-like [Anticarsia gemmatalis]|uniref:fatty acid synthase-like n=1 Tax=Anticarsia gemmatalis TaxID=129554 RepID=UPI003F76ED7F